MGVLFIFLFLAVNIALINADCTLNIKEDLSTHQPLILTTNGPKWVSLKDSSAGYVKIGRHDSVRLACTTSDPAHRNTFSHFRSESVIVAKCKAGKEFEVNNKRYTFNHLECERPVEASNIKTGQECLGKDTELIKIGFKVGNEFITEYTVCFDKKEKLTKFTEVTVPATIDKGLTSTRQQTWQNSDEYHQDINFSTLYSCESQKDTFKRILNKNFFDNNNRCCLDKGKLVSNNDVIFAPEETATANYYNTVPQWSTCNKVNWIEIERRVKNLATSLNRPLTVWTGTYRNMRLTAKWGFTSKDMYLHYTDSSHKAVPVPLYLWKVVFDQQSQKGVAIIEINNPHITLSDVKNLVLCDDICHNVNWLNFLERQTILDGYVYCCDLNNFEHGFAFKTSPFPRAPGGILRDENIRTG